MSNRRGSSKIGCFGVVKARWDLWGGGRKTIGVSEWVRREDGGDHGRRKILVGKLKGRGRILGKRGLKIIR